MPKFVNMRKEAEVALDDIADSETGGFFDGVGHSDTYTNAHAHALPTVPDVVVAALCLISTFLFTHGHLQTARPELFAAEPQSTSESQVPQGLIRWPDVKTTLRMLVKIREDYAGLSQPWTALLDTVRFSLVSKTPDQHASFVHRFSPGGSRLVAAAVARVRMKGVLPHHRQAAKEMPN